MLEGVNMDLWIQFLQLFRNLTENFCVGPLETHEFSVRLMVIFLALLIRVIMVKILFGNLG